MTARRQMRMRAGMAVLTLVLLVLLATAVGSTMFSDAGFSTVSANPADVFTAGSLCHTNDRDDQVIVDAAGLRPGVSREGTVTITGTGTVAGTYTLKKTALADSPADPGLSKTLVLLIQETAASAPLYEGLVCDLPADLLLGTIEPGMSQAYVVRVTYPVTGADPALQGASMVLSLEFTGATP